MQIWLVSPAWGRFAVTRLALAQRAHLADELAARGAACHSLVVADDENLDVADEFGAVALEHPNDPLSDKCNAGVRYACEQGADWVVWIGSDDWIHPDAFDPIFTLPGGARHTKPIMSGGSIAVVDMLNPRLMVCKVRGRNGVIPWIIPRQLLKPSGFEPLPLGKDRGLDGWLVQGMRDSRVKPAFHIEDAHDMARVDFKSSVNLNSFEALAGKARECVPDPWAALAEHYPAHLVDLARSTSIELQEAT
jgi:glycosyltransferase involved in cell wall biosynthesis